MKSRAEKYNPVEAMIDLSLEESLQAHFLAANMGHTDNDMIGELLSDPHVHVGASDGGAHILSFSTYWRHRLSFQSVCKEISGYFT